MRATGADLWPQRPSALAPHTASYSGVLHGRWLFPSRHPVVHEGRAESFLRGILKALMLGRAKQLCRDRFRTRSLVVFLVKSLLPLPLLEMRHLKFGDGYVLRHAVRILAVSSFIFVLRGYI